VAEEMMKKLALELESLAVESFPTTGAPGVSAGTVNAYESRTVPVDESIDTCQSGCQQTDTCTVTEYSCVEQTWATCYGATCFGVSCGPAGSCSQGCYV
jgi:hypothetical protein